MSNDDYLDLNEESVEEITDENLMEVILTACAKLERSSGHDANTMNTLENTSSIVKDTMEKAKGERMENAADGSDDEKKRGTIETASMDMKNLKRIVEQDEANEKGKEVKQMRKAANEVEKQMMCGDEFERNDIYKGGDHEKDKSTFHAMDSYTEAHTSRMTHDLYASADDKLKLEKDLDGFLGYQMNEVEKQEIVEDLIVIEKLIEADKIELGRDYQDLRMIDEKNTKKSVTATSSSGAGLDTISRLTGAESNGVNNAGKDVNERMMGSANINYEMMYAIPGTSGTGASGYETGHTVTRASGTSIAAGGLDEEIASCSYVTAVKDQNEEKTMANFRVNMIKALAASEEYEQHLNRIGRDHYVQVCHVEPDESDPYWYGICDYLHVNSDIYYSKYGQLCKACHDEKLETDKDYNWKPIYLHTICHKAFYANKSNKAKCDICHNIAELTQEAIQCIDCGHHFVGIGPPAYEALVIGNNPNLRLSTHIQKTTKQTTDTSAQPGTSRVISPRIISQRAKNTSKTPRHRLTTTSALTKANTSSRKRKDMDQETDEIELVPRMVLRSRNRPAVEKRVLCSATRALKPPQEQSGSMGAQDVPLLGVQGVQEAPERHVMVFQGEQEREVAGQQMPPDQMIQEAQRIQPQMVPGEPQAQQVIIVLADRQDREEDRGEPARVPREAAQVQEVEQDEVMQNNPQVAVAALLENVRAEFRLPACLHISL